jgi:2-polyprenyl-6-hydroxyphenyl methylase / 3-demethylubiquinone-9 3-methyltransferase
MIERATDSASTAPPSSSVDPIDIAKFERLGAQWWSKSGPMAALHKFNPVRLAYLRDLLCAHFPKADGQAREPLKARPLAGLRILDIGCGGGILSEPLARLGAEMTSIDPAPGNVDIARTHAEKSGLDIAYRAITAEDLLLEGAQFDVVLTMEVVEHVTDVQGFMATAAAMVRPGGLLVAATLNRTAKSFALAIVGAEYLLGWVERGTHNWQQFVTPEELEAAITAGGLEMIDETGVSYDLITGTWRLSSDMAVNYMVAAARKAG